MNYKRARLITMSVFLLIAGGCVDKPARKAAYIPPAVRVTIVNTGEVSIPVHVTGVLMSSDELKLSFKTGGIVASVSVREGERVKQGDILASLNMSEINAQVAMATGGYEKAVRDFGRVSNLYRDTVATLEQYQDAATALDVARSNLDIARFNRTHSTITAPADGIILRQFVKGNELVAPGYPVFLFGTTGKTWKVKAGLADRDYVRVNPGDSASVTFDAWPGINFPAVVEQVGELADQLTGTYESELAVSDLGYKLAAGFVAGADIYPVKKEKYTLVPVQSLVEADGLSGYVFTVRPDNRVNKIRVQIAAIVGSKAAIKDFSEEVKMVVTEGASYIKDGDEVRILK